MAVADLAGNLVSSRRRASRHPAFTFQVQDDGDTVNGRRDLDPVPKTLTFNFRPVAQNHGYTVNENQVLDQSQVSRRAR